MKRVGTARRNVNAWAFATSAILHGLALLLLLSQPYPDYQLPESVAPPVDVQIIPEPEVPPRIIVIPPHIQAPPKPQPPKVQPSPPSPKPSPAPIQAPPTPVQTPVAPPKMAPKPAPHPIETPIAPPTPAKAPVAPAPAPIAPPTPVAAPSPPITAPVHLNIHRPEKDAPNSVASLPLAPAPASGRPVNPGSPQAGGGAPGEPAVGGSRLSGLTPYGFGGMPSGGSGLRGTLIGCANAQAVSLSAVERAKCNDRFGSEAASAPALDPLSPTKRAGFDKAAAQQERDRAYRAATPVGTSNAHTFDSRNPGTTGNP